MGEAISTKNRLRILMSSGVPRRREGGVAAIIHNLGRELEKRGNEVTYVFQEDLIEPGSISQRWLDLIFAMRLSKHIARHKEKYDVVNLHAPVGFAYGLRRLWSSKRIYPPYVMTLHGLEERRVYVMSREAKKGRAWNFSWKNRVWHRYFHQPRFSWSIRTANGAHAYSRDVWNVLQLKYNMDSERVAYVPNGVEERFCSPREYRHGQKLRMLYAGSWLDQRGIYYIREALEKITKEFPEISLTVAGGGVAPEEIYGFFGSKLKANIEVQPVVPAERMHELYAEHDIFLFPSLMEGLPSVLLEAMATGMPVITTETCGMPDVVENGVNGLLIEPANSDAIVDAIRRFVNSVDDRRAMGIAAHESMSRYSWQRSANELENLFLRVVELER